MTKTLQLSRVNRVQVAHEAKEKNCPQHTLAIYEGNKKSIAVSQENCSVEIHQVIDFVMPANINRRNRTFGFDWDKHTCTVALKTNNSSVTPPLAAAPLTFNFLHFSVNDYRKVLTVRVFPLQTR